MAGLLCGPVDTFPVPMRQLPRQSNSPGSSERGESPRWEWRVRTERPRIWLDQSRVKWLREKVAGKSVEDVQALAGPSTEGLALTYVITGDEAAGRAAIDKALTDRSEYRWVGASQVAIAYDWCHPLLLSAEKSRMRDTLVREGRKEVANRRSSLTTTGGR